MKTLYESILSSTRSGKYKDPLNFGFMEYDDLSSNIDKIIVDLKKFYDFKICKPRSSQFNNTYKDLKKALEKFAGTYGGRNLPIWVATNKEIFDLIDYARVNDLLGCMPSHDDVFYKIDGKWPLILKDEDDMYWYLSVNKNWYSLLPISNRK